MASLQQDTHQLAERYDEISDLQYEHGQHLLNGLQLKAGESLLDIGSGTGRLAALAAARHVGPNGRVVGIDPLPLRINIAQERAARLKLTNLHFEIGRAEYLGGFGDQRFDAVLLNSVYHWLPHKDQVLAEAYRVLKPGGRIAISTAAREKPHDIQTLLQNILADLNLARDKQTGSTPYRVTHAQLAAQLETAGFVVNDIRLRQFSDVFSNVAAVIDFSQASAFGNFLIEYVPEVREQILSALRRQLKAQQTAGGIALHRCLHFAIATK